MPLSTSLLFHSPVCVRFAWPQGPAVVLSLHRVSVPFQGAWGSCGLLHKDAAMGESSEHLGWEQGAWAEGRGTCSAEGAFRPVFIISVFSQCRCWIPDASAGASLAVLNGL